VRILFPQQKLCFFNVIVLAKDGIINILTQIDLKITIDFKITYFPFLNSKHHISFVKLK